MTKKETIARYHLIIQKLRRFPANFEEIIYFLQTQSELQGYDYVISKRTFQRDLNDIRSLYNVDIQFNNTKEYYYIQYQEKSEYRDRMMEAFDTFNLLNVSDDLSSYIHLEQRKSKGTAYLTELLNAVKAQRRINFDYRKFTNEPLIHRELEPLGLKEFRNRWYVLGIDIADEQIKNFGVDRIENLFVKDKKFKKPEGFGLGEYYKHSFGVNRPVDEKPIKIVLSFTPFQGKYIKTLPLHHSQKIIKDNDQELRVSLFVYPTYDLWMELRSMGDEVEIMEPKNLKEKTLETNKQV